MYKVCVCIILKHNYISCYGILPKITVVYASHLLHSKKYGDKWFKIRI